MGRATAREKAERLNYARKLLQRFEYLPDAVARMVKLSGISPRQAYRYLQQAQLLSKPVPVGDLKCLHCKTFSSTGSAPARFCETHRFVVERHRESGITCRLAAEKKAWLA